MGFWSIVGIIWLVSWLINELVTFLISRESYIIRTWTRYGKERMMSSGWALVLLQPLIVLINILDLIDKD